MQELVTLLSPEGVGGSAVDGGSSPLQGGTTGGALTCSQRVLAGRIPPALRLSTHPLPPPCQGGVPEDSPLR